MGDGLSRHGMRAVRLRDRLFAPVDASLLVLMRLAFGGLMVWEVWRYVSAGRIERYYVDQPFLFSYYGFGWVRPWDGPGMHLHFQALGVFAACMTVGLFYRLAAALFFLGFTYVFLLDQSRYLNHFYLISLVAFLMILVPAHRAFSLDALMRRKLRSKTVPAWSLWLLRAQVGVVYFYGGIAKLSHDWLHGEPMRMWLAKRTDYPVLGRWFTEEWMVSAFAWGGMLYDLLVVPMLLWRRTRWLAFLWSAVFHLLNASLFDIGVFPWFMLCATLLFLPPDFFQRLWGRIRGRRGVLSAPLPQASGPLSFRQRALLGFLAVYLAVQLLFPLRHLLYPGDVNWTEEGHRFSWHMKLRSKSGDAMFLVSEPSTGRTWELDPAGYLDPRQLEKMVTHPDMIQQFAVYLAKAMREGGYGPVEVRAQVTASLNGREPQLLIDPDVDLAKVPRNLLPASWIVPLSQPLPDAGSRKRRRVEVPDD